MICGKCSDCVFFRNWTNTCHLNPPVYIGLESPNYQSSMLHTFKFPTVQPDDWCGGFVKKLEERERE